LSWPGVSPLYIRVLGKYAAFMYMTLAALCAMRRLEDDELILNCVI
jgi:hypothetical protein